MQTVEVRDRVVEALEELKAVELSVLDVRERTSITDLMIIASGNSSRHVKSLAESVVRKSKAAGDQPLGVEGLDAGEWALVDLGVVIVHVMLPKVRDFYQIEKLWAAPLGEDDADMPNDSPKP